MVKTLLSNARGCRFNPWLGSCDLTCFKQKNPNIKQKQYCNKFNKDLKKKKKKKFKTRRQERQGRIHYTTVGHVCWGFWHVGCKMAKGILEFWRNSLLLPSGLTCDPPICWGPVVLRRELPPITDFYHCYRFMQNSGEDLSSLPWMIDQWMHMNQSHQHASLSLQEEPWMRGLI